MIQVETKLESHFDRKEKSFHEAQSCIAGKDFSLKLEMTYQGGAE